MSYSLPEKSIFQKNSLLGYLSPLLSSDPRTLAVFRIAIALLVQVDALLRLKDCTAFYGAKSILPLAQWFADSAPITWFSLYFISDYALLPEALLLLQFLAGLGLMLGVMTRLCSFLCWLLLLSVQIRNPFILNSGDNLLLHLLVWVQFLPCDRSFVLAQNSARRNRCPSAIQNCIYMAAILGASLQMIGMYVSTGIAKLSIPAWQSGMALSIALSKDALTTDFGSSLLNLHSILPAVSYTTLFLELLLAPLLLSPWKNELCRTIVLPCFFLFHLVTALCFDIGLFPYTSIAGLLIFIPRSFWSSLERSHIGTYIGQCSRERNERRDVLQAEPHHARNSVSALIPLVSIFIFYIIFSYSHLSQLMSSPLSIPTLDRITSTLRFTQSWRMFVRQSSGGGWHHIEGIRWDGERSDILRQTEVSTDAKPENIAKSFRSYRWRKLLGALRKKAYSRYRDTFGEFLIRRWNHQRDPEQHLAIVRWHFIQYTTPDRRATTLGFSPEDIGKKYQPLPPLKKKLIWQWESKD